MGHIFISYSHKDKDYVHRLQEILQNQGFEVWIDDRMDYGIEWPTEIERRLDECDAFILVASDNAKKSNWVQNEVRRAERTGKPFFPLLLQGEPWLYIERLQWLDVKDKSLPDEKFFRGLAKFTSRRKPSLIPIEDEKLEAKREQKVKEERGRIAAQKAEAERKRIEAELGHAVDNVIQESAARFERQKTKRQREIWWKRWGVPIMIIALILLFAGVSANYLMRLSNSNDTPTETLTIPTETVTSQVTISLSAEVIPTESQTLLVSTLTPPVFPSSPDISSTITPDIITMMYVPEGNFTMGSDNGDPDERPVHVVYLDAFWIDQTEVTNAMYAKCVFAGVCKEPSNKRSNTHPNYYENSEFNNYPVIYVNWNMATTYCTWNAKRLPTEAEWEKAARGTDGRTYPWGEGINCDKANYYDGNNYCVNDTTKVSRYFNSVSPYGFYDMAGNVWEWVSDWYDRTYYQKSPSWNPLGPDLGSSRVLRGGSWYYDEIIVRSASRGWKDPIYNDSNIGFRCAKSP